MIDNQRSLKDKHRLGFTEDIASTSKTKTKKLSPVDEETPTVEPAVPVPSAREPASSNERNRPSAEESEILESNVRLKIKLESDEWIKDSGCSRHMTGNKDLFSTYEAINGGDNQKEVIDEGFSDLEKTNNDDEHEIAEIFRLETNLFDYETPLCTKFNEFKYLLKVDMELFTHDIQRTKTYEDYENELNNELDEPWFENGVPYEICDHIYEPFRFKNGKAKWPTCSSNDDGFCNGGELSGMVQVGYMNYFQDHEWYDDLIDGSLKKEALKQTAIYEKSWGDATQSAINFCAWLKTCFGNFHELDYELLIKLQDYWWKVKDHEYSPFTNWRDHIHGPYTNYYCNAQDEEEQEDKG
ncbi:hypothetical protein Tco_1315303 [Tanacetum coccineum]